MKTKLITAVMALVMALSAAANSERSDAWLFERYMQEIRAAAPIVGIKIKQGDEEYFWLYCFIESPCHPISPLEAVKMAKRDWARESK